MKDSNGHKRRDENKINKVDVQFKRFKEESNCIPNTESTMKYEREYIVLALHIL